MKKKTFCSIGRKCQFTDYLTFIIKLISALGPECTDYGPRTLWPSPLMTNSTKKYNKMFIYIIIINVSLPVVQLLNKWKFKS